MKLSSIKSSEGVSRVPPAGAGSIPVTSSEDSASSGEFGTVDAAEGEAVSENGSGQPELAGGSPATSTLQSTPSGNDIYFQWEPERLYKVKPARGEWKQVPSVTEILKVVNKPGLIWWGMEVGIAGTIDWVADDPDNFKNVPTPEEVVEYLKENKLTVNDVRDKAGDRGTSVHNALEAYLASEGAIMPQPELYPDNEKGYVQGLVKFLEDVKFAGAPSYEVMVGSLKHGYAGRFDLLADLDICELNITPKQKRREFMAGRYLIDLKTTSAVYDTHYLQLEAYEYASRECGYDQSEFRAVLRVTEDGLYELKTSPADFDMFLAVKSAYEAIESLKGRKSR